MSKNYIKTLTPLLLFIFSLILSSANAQIAAWDFNGIGGLASQNANSFDPNFSITPNLTRGSTASASAGANTFRTTGFKNDGISTSNTDYFEVQLKSKSGFKLSLSNIVARFDGTSTFFDPPGVSSQFAYSLDGFTFTLINSPNIITSAFITSNIDLTSISALQNLTSATTIYLRYYASGQTTTGGWGFASAPSPGTNGLAIGGSLISDDATYYFRSAGSGAWNNPSSWESSLNGMIPWSPAIGIPTSSAAAINILSPHVITLNAITTANTLTIESGAKLSHPAVYGLTIVNGPALADMNILGTYEIFGAQPTLSGSSVYIQPNGVVKVIDNASPGNSDLFPTISNVYFLTNAVFEWATNSLPTLQTLPIFPNPTGVIPIYRFSVSPAPLGGPSATVINGILDARVNISFAGNGSKTFRDGITGTSTVTIPSSISGSININGSAPILGGSNLTINIDKPINIPSGITIPAGAVVKIQPITSTYVPNFAKGTGVNFQVDGTIDMTTSEISNTSGAVIINGTLKTAHLGGLENTVLSGGGTVATLSSTTQVNAGSTVEYNATANQYITGTGVLEGLGVYDNIILSGSATKTPTNLVDINTTGSVTILGTNTIADFSTRNLANSGTNTTSFTMTSGRLKLGTTGTLPNMRGIYNLTGGIIEFAGSANQSIRDANYQKIEVTGIGVSSGGGNISLNTNGTFTVKPSGIFEMIDNSIIGPLGNQTLSIESGGLFKCSVEGGFYGPANGLNLSPSVRNNIETISLAVGSTVLYARTLSGGAQSITNTPVAYQNLNIAGTGTKTAPSATLTIQGNLIKSGTSTFAHNNGTVLLNGTVTQTYSAITPTPTMSFYNIINSNNAGFIVNDSIAIEKTLTLSDLSKTTLNTGDVILKSIATNTATIPAIGTGTITYGTGRFIVERFINSGVTHGQTWQFVSAPASGETVKATWQENQTYRPLQGVWITKPTAAAGMGYDGNSITYSLKSFNSASNQWEGKVNTTDLINEPRGYMLFVRGDRNVQTPSNTTTVTTLRTRGKIYSPSDVPYTLSGSAATGTFLSVGNPYPSAISLSVFNSGSTGLETNYWLWDPSLYGLYGVGGYQSITSVTGNLATPGGSTIYAAGAYPNIQSGQAFFVKTNAPSYNIGFTESMKVNTNILVNRANGQAEINASEITMLSTMLYTSAGVIADGNRVVFDPAYNNTVDDLDATKLSNAGENFGLLRDNKSLSVEARNILSTTDTLFYKMSNLQTGQYKLIFAPQNFSGINISGELIDSYLKTRTDVSLIDSSFIPVDITSEIDSKAPNRFMLVFKTAKVLQPVTFISITAQRQDKNILVSWMVGNEQNIDHYEVERSANGRNFYVVATEAATNNSGTGNTSYSWLDTNPGKGVNFYRVRSIGTSKEAKYSDTVKASGFNASPAFSVYPNPIGNNGKINLYLTDQPEGLYQVRILNAAGQSIFQKSITHTGGSATYPISINATMASGNYLLKIENDKGNSETINLQK